MTGVSVRLGDLKPRIENWAQEHGYKTAEAIRLLLTIALDQAEERAARDETSR